MKELRVMPHGQIAAATHREEEMPKAEVQFFLPLYLPPKSPPPLLPCLPKKIMLTIVMLFDLPHIIWVSI